MDYIEGLGCVQGGLVDLPQPFVINNIALPHLLGKFLWALLIHQQWKTFPAALAKSERQGSGPLWFDAQIPLLPQAKCRPASGRQKSLPGFPRRLFRIISLFPLTQPSQPSCVIVKMFHDWVIMGNEMISWKIWTISYAFKTLHAFLVEVVNRTLSI